MESKEVMKVASLDVLGEIKVAARDIPVKIGPGAADTLSCRSEREIVDVVDGELERFPSDTVLAPTVGLAALAGGELWHH
jgi:hypothetical protein